jgi:hypothetical protein
MHTIGGFMYLFFFLILIAFTASPVRGEEFSVLGGKMEQAATQEPSYAWQLEYLEGLSEHLAYSLSYLNEGHVPNHHRDGQTAQLWVRTNLLDRHLSLLAGVGTFLYFDTTTEKQGASFSDDHGVGAMYSLTAIWYTQERFFFQVQSNFVETQKSINTFSTLVGVGYQLDAPEAQGPLVGESPQQEQTTNNELTLFAGQAIVNSFNSEKEMATSIEYRRGLLTHLDWTATWFKEGNSRLNQQNGIATELWAVSAVLDDQLAVGLGVGSYFAVSQYNLAQQSSKTVSGLVTMSASYRFDPKWNARISWDRLVTTNNRDADILLGGVGYRF